MTNHTQNPSGEEGSSALIPVFSGEIAGQPVQLCNARELHQFLGVARDFTSWIKKRLSDGGFVQDQDYLLTKFGEQVPHQGGTRTVERIDYHLILDCAKHIGMMERNEAGNRVRQYFIEMERQAQAKTSLPPPKKKPREAAHLDIDASSIMETLIGGMKSRLKYRKSDGQDQHDDHFSGDETHGFESLEEPEASDDTELNRRAWAVTHNYFPLVRELLADGEEPPPGLQGDPDPAHDEIRLLLTLHNLQVTRVDLVGQDKYLLSLDGFIKLARKAGLVVMTKDELVGRLVGEED